MVTHSFTNLWQNVCLTNTYILIYWNARRIYKLWKALRFYCVFWVFSYIIDEYSCQRYCIFTKLSQMVCLINMYILKCQHAKCDCWLWFNCIFWVFWVFWVTFQVTLCSYYFCNFRKKVPRPKWTIYKHVSDNSKKGLSIGNFFFCLSSLSSVYSVARLQPTPAYVEAWNIY